MLCALLAVYQDYSLLTALEVKSDLAFEISVPITYFSKCILLIQGPQASFECFARAPQPKR